MQQEQTLFGNKSLNLRSNQQLFDPCFRKDWVNIHISMKMKKVTICLVLAMMSVAGYAQSVVGTIMTVSMGVNAQTSNTVRGDVNGDGAVNAADIVSIVNIIMGGGSDVNDAVNGDVNRDGAVNAADIVVIVNIIMGIDSGDTHDVTEGMVLQVLLSDGQVVSIDLNEEPRTTYRDGNLVITSTKNTMTYPLEQVKRFTYTNKITKP